MTLSAAKPLIRRHAEIGIFLIGAVLIVLFATTSDGRWANLYNIGTILQVTATLGLMSLGVALVIGTGEVDISVGSTFGMGALVYLWFAPITDPAIAALAAIAVGAAIGLVNGLLVTRTGTPSLIITLGTLMIFRGNRDRVDRRIFLFRSLCGAQGLGLLRTRRRRLPRIQYRALQADPWARHPYNHAEGDAVRQCGWWFGRERPFKGRPG
jgi:hypothetical protein